MQHLILWPFFQAIEKQLSYERWIDKYKIFQQYLTAHPPQLASDWDDLRVLCRLLYLQEFRDRKQFDTLLDQAIEQEKQVWLERARVATSPAVEKPNPTGTGPGDLPSTAKESTPSTPEKNAAGNTTPQTQETGKTTLRYFRPPEERVFSSEKFGKTSAGLSADSGQFLHSDEYLPYTRRQMAKAWQRLRRRQQSGFSDEMDLPATVQMFAKNGLLLAPAYRPGYVNRPDTLLIFSDVRGSMTPFFELTERMVDTARHLGGHRNAGVFYFQNVPLSNVYQHANLTGAVPVKTALQKANKQHTVAVVVSDAGAARANPDPAAQQMRLAHTRNFLNLLREYTQKVIWFNPMPEHRWPGTCAAQIVDEKLVALMVPVFENATLDPQEWIKKLIRY
jgi:uncharacterized protein with von Willebrand factor type A (vWA) domain